MWADVRSKRIDDDGLATLEVSVPAKAIDAKIGECVSYVGQQGGLFGAIEREDLVKRYGAAETDALIAQWMMQAFSYPALESLRASVACDPECTLLAPYSYGDDLLCCMKTYLLPQGTLSSADPVSVVLAQDESLQGEIDEQLQRLAESQSKLVTVDEVRPAKMGDIVKVDTRVSRDGQVIGAYSKDGAYLKMQTGAMPDEFIGQVVDMLPGEIKEFRFQAPKRMGRAGMEEYDARVGILSLHALEVPQIDDEWARGQYPGVSGLDEVRTAIASALADGEGRSSLIDNAVDAAIAQRLSVDLPDGLVEFAAARLEAVQREQLADNGTDLDHLLARQGISADDHHADLREQAEDSLRTSIALDALFSELGLSLSQEDVDEALAELSPGGGVDAKHDYILEGKMHLVEDAARRSMAHRWLVETAVVE